MGEDLLRPCFWKPVSLGTCLLLRHFPLHSLHTQESSVRVALEEVEEWSSS